MYHRKVTSSYTAETVEKMNLFLHCLGNEEWGKFFSSKNFNIAEITFTSE